jgi:carboxyl-terminal processing protease
MAQQEQNRVSNLAALWKKSQTLRTTTLIAIVFLTGFLFGSQSNFLASAQIDLNQEEQQEFAAFWQAYDLVRSQYLDQPIDTHLVVEGAIAGMLDSLGDQYTGYMSSEVYSLMNEDISGEIQGIGVVIRTIQETGEIEVANVMKDTPAERAGVQIGDIFVIVDGEDVLGYTQLELAGIVRGPRGTTVDITFRRGDELVEENIERDRIPIPTAEYTLLENDIALIRLFEFNSQSRPQLDAAIEELGGADNLDGLVLDLRGNPGGTLDSSIEIASTFLDDKVILREQFPNREETLSTDGSYAGYEFPVVILVNETSASASELVSGALQDWDAATIIGEVTFGKGTVQSWRGLSNGGGVRITIARWLTPNGNWINEEGITPDIVIEWEPEPNFFLDINDPATMVQDPQLQAAIAVLNGEMVEDVILEAETAAEMEDAEALITE